MREIINNFINQTTLEELMNGMEKCEVDSLEWRTINSLKAIYLERNKPSTREIILTFKEKDLEHIPLGFSEYKDNLDIEVYEERRSLLEYNPIYRHPIPYVIIKNKSKYFFILREAGSGEAMLIGKKGMVGGHVAVDDIEKNDSVVDSIIKGLYRELEEEAGITGSIITDIALKGVIKSNEGVDRYHLGLIYEIEINTTDIKAEEEGVLTGIWIDKEDLSSHYNSFESWAKIVYDHILQSK
mgnify:CR=1 FL=1